MTSFNIRFLCRFGFVVIFPLGWLFAGNPPSWEVNPSDYQFTANMTAILYMDYEFVEGDSNIVGAFSEDTCRGVASPLLVMDQWMYFLTIYSNSTSEQIIFKAYIAGEDTILDIVEDIEFVPNASYGDPTSPYELNTILNFDHSPIVSGITDQTIEVGNSFTSFDLDNFLTELDGDSVDWSAAGNIDLLVMIGDGNVVTVLPPDGSWIGSETVVFTATDVTQNELSSSDTTTFTVLPLDHPPQLNTIPDQTIGQGGQFSIFDLDDYLLEEDGDSVVWDYRFQPSSETDDVPDWLVNASDYVSTMSITARVISRGKETIGSDHLLAAFVGDTCRGVTTAVSALGEWLYFLPVYANTNGEDITFKFYDTNSNQLLHVLDELVFTVNEAYGTPEDPFQLYAGHLLIGINDTRATAYIVDASWAGSETIHFKATDYGTLHNYSDSTSVTFTILPDHTPLVAGIPDQTIEQGSDFQQINLDSYLTEIDQDTIIWSAVGNVDLIVIIDQNNVASIVPPNTDWTGSESIVFIATDDNPNAFFSSDTSVFTVLSLDHAPQVNSIPDQTIGFLGSFSPILLDGYLTESDEDSIVWSYTFQPPLETGTLPDWSIQPENYEVTMTVTARVISRGVNATGSDHILAAFAGDEIRGVTSAISALGEWLYFLPVYANTNGEDITFKFYDTNSNQLLPVLEGLVFTVNEAHGTPEDPFQLYAGHLLIRINDTRATAYIVDASWAGSETIQFKATDYGTLHNYSDSTSVTFTILPDHTPLVAGIPDQTIDQGSDFQQINLNSYLTEIDEDTIIWSAIGNVDLIVIIDQNSVASIVPPNTDWTGSESIVFTATDDNPNAFFSSDTVLFTIQSMDYPPQVADISGQTIGIGGQFEFIYLDDFLTELDDDEIGWSYVFSPFVEWQGPPDWSVQPQDYEFSMNLTTMTTIRDGVSDTSANMLGAFVGDVCRGVAKPQFILDQWLYFMTIYGDTNGDSVDFRVYHSEFGDVVSVVEKIEFISNDIIGSPENPFQMKATNLSISINSSHVAQIRAMDISWSGTEAVHFIAQDMGTQHQYSDSSLVIFTVLPHLSPVVAEIPHQTIDEGESFASFDLDDYLVQPEASLITWSHSGEQEWIVAIDMENVVTVSTPDEDWFGSETIRFTATDISNPVLLGWDEVDFVIIGVNDAPTADDLAVATTEDLPLDLTLSGSDIEGDSLTFTVLTGPLHGTYDGVIYVPDPNYYGQDSLSYITNDGVLDSEPATATISIRSINDLPFVESPLQDVSIDEDDFGAIIIPRLEDYFDDVDEGDHLTFDGLALDEGLDSIAIGTLNNTALAGMLVGDAIRSGKKIFSIKRSALLVDSHKVNSKIGRFKTDTQNLKNMQAPLVRDELNLLKKSNNNSMNSIRGIDDTTSLVVYPTENFNGNIRITVTATDDSSASISDTLLLTIAPLNDAPVLAALADTSMNEDDSLSLVLSAFDADDDSLSFTAESDTSAVRVSVAGNLLHISLEENWFGLSIITVSVADEDTSMSSDFTLIILPVNDVPVSDAGIDQTAFEGTTVVLDGSASSDVDGDQITFQWTIPPGITVSDPTIENPTFIAPDVSEDSMLIFMLMVNDGELDSEVDTVTIVIAPVVLEGLPDFTEQPPTTGEPVTIGVTLPDFFVIDTISLYYIKGGDPGFQSIPMTPSGLLRSTGSSGGGSFSGEIPGDAISYAGAAYFIHAVDTSGNIINTDTLSIPVKFSAHTITSQMENSAYPNGIPKKKWRIISVPTELDDPTVSTIFEAEFGEKPGTDSWKLYEWTGSEWNLATEVTSGKGYWLQQRVKTTSSFTTGSGKSVDITGVTLIIQPGWNLVGSPYPFTVDVNMDSSLFSGPWSYGDFDGEGWMGGISQLQPWGGYGLYNWTESEQTLKLQPLENLGSLVKQTTSLTDGWILQLMATGDIYSDRANYMGRRASASNEWDFHDQPEPPYIEGYVSLSMDHPEWGHRITRFSSDIRSINEEIGIWDVTLRVKGEKGPITISNELSGEFPGDHEIWLLDLTTRESFNLIGKQEIMITGYSEKFPSHFKVVTGPSDQIKRIIEDVWSQLPAEFSLSQNYPNPFNPFTTIRYELREPSQVTLIIYDLLGREVTTLVNEVQDLGVRTVRWDGRDDQGLNVSAGIYLYRISVKPFSKSGGFIKTRKMILLK